MSLQTDLRKAIKAKYPNIQFKIRTIDFTDLARESRIFVESNEWGMTKGNQEVYHGVKTIADKFNVITSW